MDQKSLPAGLLFYLGALLVATTAFVQSQTLAIDPTFSLTGNYSPGINYILLQPDGKLILTGGFNTAGGAQNTQVARINPNGTPDLIFNADTVLKAPVYCAQIQNDGKIIVGGLFNHIYFQGPRNFLARLNSNGTLDTSFKTLGGFDNMVTSLLLQPDGKVIVAGFFFNFNGNTCPRIARIDTNGGFDLNFNIGSGFNGDVFPIALQTDGKIVAGGAFTTYNGAACNRIVRLTTNGILDISFNSGVGFGPGNCYLSKIIVQPDGKILAGGNFSSYRNSPANNLLRINSDGTTDNSFNAGTGFDNSVVDMALQNDGKIIVTGNFNSYNGNPAPKIARLNPNGSIDPSFNPGLGFDKAVLLILQPDAKIICGGFQTQFNNASCNGVLRFNNNLTTEIENTKNDDAINQNWSIYPNPCQDFIRVNSDEPFDFEISDSNGRLVKSGSVKANNIGVSELAEGVYYLAIQNSSKAIHRKIVKLNDR